MSVADISSVAPCSRSDVRYPTEAAILADGLLSLMLSGHLQFSDKLSERILCAEFNATRAVVREALSILAQNGYLKRARRVGTTQANRPVFIDSSTPTRDRVATTSEAHIASILRKPATRMIARILDVRPGTEITEIMRFAERDGRVSERWLTWSPHDIRFELGPLDRRSWTLAVASASGSRTVDIEWAVVDLIASPVDAETLGVDAGGIIRFVDQTILTPDGGVVARSVARVGSARAVTRARKRWEIADEDDYPAGSATVLPLDGIH